MTLLLVRLLPLAFACATLGTWPLLTSAATPVGAQHASVSLESIWLQGEGDNKLHAGWRRPDAAVGGVVLVHQCDRTSSTLTGFEPLIPHLIGRRLAVLDLDLRGYGRSPAIAGPDDAAGSIRFAKDIETAYAFMRAKLQPGGAIALIGASCGGREALRFAGPRTDIAAVALLSSGLPAALTPRPDLPVLAILATRDRLAGSLRQFGSRHPATQLREYDSDLHGTPLLVHDPTLPEFLATWVEKHVRSTQVR